MIKEQNIKNLGKYAQKGGVHIIKRPDVYSNKKDIVNQYNNGNSMELIAKEFNCSISLIQKILQKESVKMRKGGHVKGKIVRKDIRQKSNEILEMYEKGMAMEKIAQYFKCDVETAKKILLQANIQIRNAGFYAKGISPPNKLKLDEKEIIEMYQEQNIAGIKIAKIFNCHYSVIYDILKKHEIKIKGSKFFNLGKTSHMKGKKHSSHARELLRKSTTNLWKNEEFRKNHSGKNASNWLGGKSFEPYGEEFNNNLKTQIRKRENQVCMNCGIHREKLNKALDIHHINYDKQCNFVENLISLCRDCHLLTLTNREYWTKLFQEKLTKLYDYKYSEDGKIIIELNMNGGKN